MHHIPWGYTPHEEDPLRCIPDPDKLDHLEAAKQLVRQGSSYRDAAGWLLDKTDLKLSHSGLGKRIKSDNKYFKELDYDSLDKVYYHGDEEPEGYAKPTGHIERARKTNRQYINAHTDPKERELARQKVALRQAKTAATKASNKIKKFAAEIESEEKLKEMIPEDIREEIYEEERDAKQNVMFRPNPGPQTDFLASWEDEVFYGGARGGGKTYSLVVDPLRYVHNGNFRGLIMRRTTVELRDIERESKKLYDKLDAKAKYNKTEKIWTFGSGAQIELGYAETEDDAERYRGQSYSWVGFDELPQYPDSSVYDLIKSSVRSPDPTLPTQIRATGNPGNVGSAWVKAKFIDPAPSNTTFYETHELRDPRTGQVREIKRSIRYIPASVYDNPYLVADDSYIAALASLPEVKRKQMLEGNWDVILDGAFPEFDRSIHVCEPFAIPPNWMKFRAADWGYSSPFCCLWFAVDWDDNVYIYREYYGQGVYADEWAKTVCEAEPEYVDYGVIDGSTKISRGERGSSIFDTINKEMRKYGKARFKPADRSPGSRAAGKQAVHQYLALRETGLRDDLGNPVKAPRLRIFSNCVNLIRTLPQLSLDKNDPEKVSKKQEDHAYDTAHYGLRSIPKSKRLTWMNQKTEKTWQPKDKTFGY